MPRFPGEFLEYPKLRAAGRLLQGEDSREFRRVEGALNVRSRVGRQHARRSRPRRPMRSSDHWMPYSRRRR
jgi:hypothetical protein